MGIRYLTLTAALLLGGCAGEMQMRSVSSKTAEILTTYKGSLQQFAASQSRLNAATEARLFRLKQMADARRAETDTRHDAWRLADDKEALRQFDVIASVSPEHILASANPQLPPPGLDPLKFEPADVDALIKPLVELTKPITPRQRVEQLLAYGTAVRDAYQKDLAEAKAETDAATTGTTAKAAEDETGQQTVEDAVAAPGQNGGHRDEQ